MSKQKAFKSIILIVVMVIMLSCTNETSTEPQLETYLKPLDIGNYWIYNLSTFEEPMRYEVVEEIEFLVDGALKPVKRIAMANLDYYEFNDDEGYHYIQNFTSVAGEDSLSNFSVLKYKYPVTINDSWFQDFENDGLTSNDNVVECISTNTIINFTAGDFECIAYKVTCPDLTDNYRIEYYCIGIGLIKTISFDQENNTFDERSLVQYHVQE